MAYGESKNKLGDRGRITGEKTFNKSGAREGSKSPQTEWQGKSTAGKNRHKGD